MLITQVPVLFETTANDPHEIGWKAWIQQFGRGRSKAQDRVENNSSCIAFKCQPTGRHLVEDGTEREDVAASVDFFTARLLGRHIRNGPDSGTGACDLIGSADPRRFIRSCGAN